jgi:hypothetical protein
MRTILPVILGHLSLVGNTTAPRNAACTPYSLQVFSRPVLGSNPILEWLVMLSPEVTTSLSQDSKV